MTDDEPGVISRPDSEREQAERRYVSALIALDAAAEPSPTVAAAAAATMADVVRLNDIWQQNAPRPGDATAAGRLKRVIAELARWLPWRRRRLQGAMIAAINRNAETSRALVDATQHFQSHVIWYAQTIAALAAAPRRGDTGATSVAALHQAINAIGTEWLTHWESLGAREHRADARMEALTRAYQDLKDTTALAQQSTIALKRSVEQVSAGVTATPSAAAPAAITATTATGPDTNAYKYVGFEDRFRGSRDDIRERLRPYLAVFAGATNVLDVGCGRGELLDLFREHGVAARGIDVNEEMAGLCRDRGLTVERADALAYLNSQKDGSLGGLVAIQVVEHFDAGYLMRFLDAAYAKLAPGAPIVLETINPSCWTAFFDSYIRDLTHVHPLHPDTLKYLVQASGYQSLDVRFLSPVADADRLPGVQPTTDVDRELPALVALTEAVNAHADRLNARLFTFRDYAIVARR